MYQLHIFTQFQTLAGYDEDSTLSIDYLLSLKTCNGRIGTTGMCLGGHLAYRCALDPRVAAAVTYFATDLHSATLGLGKKDDSLARASEIKGELAMIHGTLDNHVPPEGRDLIRKTLREKGVIFSWYEVAGAQRKCLNPESCSVSLTSLRRIYPGRALQRQIRSSNHQDMLRDLARAIRTHAEIRPWCSRRSRATDRGHLLNGMLKAPVLKRPLIRESKVAPTTSFPVSV